MLVVERMTHSIAEAGPEGGNNGMALGEQLGEVSGRITGTRVLAPEGQQVKVEVSLEGRGTMLGEDISDLGTYWQTVRPGGELYGEGNNVWLTNDGENVLWRGFGVGRPTGPPPAGHFAVCGWTQTESQRFVRLNSVATAIEYDVDAEGNYHWTLWEWK
jgi:hypothetical protein